MEAGCRRGRGRVLRPRDRAPDTPRNHTRQREEDTTIALLRQQQEIMAQMVDFFLERQPVVHPPKRPRTELVSPKPNVGGTTSSGPTPQAPPQGWLGLPPSERREGRSTHSLCHLQVTSVRCPP
ncbi:hypothetical protein GEV33_012404 [Tenebrio molitor]|jgi:hypothetical protein|nr:hypothetical protein GEV33_012404 [Tenebrio molitor]